MLRIVFLLTILIAPSWGSEADALAIDANIRTNHMPFGTILDPIYASSTSNQIVNYTRCGDSALWTGAYLAAEAFRYKVTQSNDALNNIQVALAGLKALADVTGDNRLARCMVKADSPYATSIQNEEAHSTIHQASPWIWVDNTSRDQVVGVFFGLGVAYDLVDDAAVRISIGALATRLSQFIAGHQWSPNDDISRTFQLRPEELQMLLQVSRHVDPNNHISGPFLVLPVDVAVRLDVGSNDSYFKFNLDYMTFYNLVRLQNNGDNMNAYKIVRNYTAPHQNAFFDLIDRALQGPNAARDAEAASLLDQWLQRSRRDPSVDLTKTVSVCGVAACQPVPVPLRPPTDFIWQRDPFQLTGGGSGVVESAGIDYILPYWMMRYFAIQPVTGAIQSAAAANGGLAPNSIASLFGANLASSTAQATTQPLPSSLGGISLVVKDSSGAQRNAPLSYVSPAQINFVIPDGTATGQASVTVMNGAATQTFTATIQAVAPALFSANMTGSGVAAATAIRVQVSNPSLQAPVAVFQCGSNAMCFSVPINLGIDTPVYVSFYGTGIRGRNSLNDVKVTINGTNVPVLYAGPAPGFTGLDQVNVGLVLNLRGSGESNVVLSVAGQMSNTVSINVQ